MARCGPARSKSPARATIELSRGELVEKAITGIQTSKSPKDAVYDALWPTLRSVISRGRLIRFMDAAFSEGCRRGYHRTLCGSKNEWGWDVVGDINTKKDLGHFVGDITKLVDRRSTVRLVLRR